MCGFSCEVDMRWPFHLRFPSLMRPDAGFRSRMARVRKRKLIKLFLITECFSSKHAYNHKTGGPENGRLLRRSLIGVFYSKCQTPERARKSKENPPPDCRRSPSPSFLGLRKRQGDREETPGMREKRQASCSPPPLGWKEISHKSGVLLWPKVDTYPNNQASLPL